MLPCARVKLLRNSRFLKLFDRRVRKRLDPREKKELVVDVCGVCNLRCPSCPVGGIGYESGTLGLMDVDLFRKLIAKADDEFWIKGVNLFNWGEPMLHPRLPELIRIVKSRRLKCFLSTNLNLLRNIDEVLAARPDELRISLSGFTPGVYGQTHARGNIERVKRNMREFAEALARVDPPLPLRRGEHEVVQVFFHKYRHNLDEVEPMRELAAELGFGFSSCWAYYMSQEQARAVIDGQLGPEQRRFVEWQFALPIPAAIDAARAFRDEPCRLLEEQLVLDLQGNLVPCCTIYDLEVHRLGSYLDMSIEEQRAAKAEAPVCKRCTDEGLHKYFTYSENAQLWAIYEELTERNLAERGPLRG